MIWSQMKSSTLKVLLTWWVEAVQLTWEGGPLPCVWVFFCQSTLDWGHSYTAPAYYSCPERERVVNPVGFISCRQNLQPLIGWGTISVTSCIIDRSGWRSGKVSASQPEGSKFNAQPRRRMNMCVTFPLRFTQLSIPSMSVKCSSKKHRKPLIWRLQPTIVVKSVQSHHHTTWLNLEIPSKITTELSSWRPSSLLMLFPALVVSFHLCDVCRFWMRRTECWTWALSPRLRKFYSTFGQIARPSWQGNIIKASRKLKLLRLRRSRIQGLHKELEQNGRVRKRAVALHRQWLSRRVLVLSPANLVRLFKAQLG